MRPKQYSFMIAVRDEIHVRPGPRTAGLRWVLAWIIHELLSPARLAMWGIDLCNTAAKEW